MKKILMALAATTMLVSFSAPTFAALNPANIDESSHSANIYKAIDEDIDDGQTAGVHGMFAWALVEGKVYSVALNELRKYGRGAGEKFAEIVGTEYASDLAVIQAAVDSATALVDAGVPVDIAVNTVVTLSPGVDSTIVERIIYRDAVRTVTEYVDRFVNVPGPERIVNVPGPERIVYRDRATGVDLTAAQIVEKINMLSSGLVTASPTGATESSFTFNVPVDAISGDVIYLAVADGRVIEVNWTNPNTSAAIVGSPAIFGNPQVVAGVTVSNADADAAASSFSINDGIAVALDGVAGTRSAGSPATGFSLSFTGGTMSADALATIARNSGLFTIPGGAALTNYRPDISSRDADEALGYGHASGNLQVFLTTEATTVGAEYAEGAVFYTSPEGGGVGAAVVINGVRYDTNVTGISPDRVVERVRRTARSNGGTGTLVDGDLVLNHDPVDLYQWSYRHRTIEARYNAVTQVEVTPGVYTLGDNAVASGPQHGDYFSDIDGNPTAIYSAATESWVVVSGRTPASQELVRAQGALPAAGTDGLKRNLGAAPAASEYTADTYNQVFTDAVMGTHVIDFSIGEIITQNHLNAIEDAINEAFDTGYDEGYKDGFADGYVVGFSDGVNSVTN